MKFIQVINEYSFDIPYPEWMKRQVDLWKQVCEKDSIDKNDVNKFKKFGRFFDLFYKKTHHFPTLQDVEKVLI